MSKSNSGELARQALDDGYQAVALEVGKSYEALQRENARLRAALEQVEWVSMAGCDHSMTECPWCGEYEWRERKHAADCARQLALTPESVDGK